MRFFIFLNSLDFNPRSREGSDKHTHDTESNNDISIHAPAKGATHTGQKVMLLSFISIHAPAKGATGFRCPPRRCLSYFNPRSREGSDANSLKSMANIANFNPRSREGSDRTDSKTQMEYLNFNPRSREGSDNRSAGMSSRTKNFNPRSREGSDYKD